MKDVGFKLKNLEKKIGGSFISEARGFTKAQLEAKLLELSKYREQIEEAQKDDPDIQEMKEELKELNRPYNESKKANSLKSKAIYLLMLEQAEEDKYCEEHENPIKLSIGNLKEGVYNSEDLL